MIQIAQAVYIHIPFCNRLCPYCDFTKFVLKGQPVMEYLQALRQEMETTVDRYPAKQIKTIFVGGGTPTTLSAEQMAFLFQSIKEMFPLEKELEFTMEANPECITKEKLEAMKAGGVNRLSFGVQTFDPQLLKKLGRLHTREHVYAAIQLAKELGFENISIDLMFGLPEQTLTSLQETLEQAFALGTTHFSAYSLQVEEGTHFFNLYQKDKLLLPSEDVEVQMFETIITEMEKHGYQQYEISNFAQPGFESEHNLTYWRNEEYYGLGVGAHGYVQGIRYANLTSLSGYIDSIAKHGLAQEESHPVSRKEAMEEMLVMGLRTREGVAKESFFERFGATIESIYGKELTQLLQLDLLETDGNSYFLTKKGIFLGNEVFAYFLLD